MDNGAGQKLQVSPSWCTRGQAVSTRGLSLVGFIDQQRQALEHLRNYCVHPDISDGPLLKEWATAKTKIGSPIPKAGAPDVRQLRRHEAPHIRAPQDHACG